MHDHVVAKPGHHVHVMLDEQDGDAVGDQAFQMLADLLGQRRVDAGDRLVEQDQLRLGHQGAADLEQLLLAARQIGGRIADDVHEVQAPGDGHSAGDELFLALARGARIAARP